ncbi:MAG: diadenylate cyclase CdaA [Bdellovibrionales bacterium]|nr:diadenylate cyclase CdaA [Bdellovibrionales bacterium]
MAAPSQIAFLATEMGGWFDDKLSNLPLSPLLPWEAIRFLIDVAIVAYLVYRGLLIIKGTRAAPMLGGLSLIVVLYFLATPLGLVTLGWLLGNFLSSIILVVVVIFQDEIRRGLTKFGLQPLFGSAKQTIYDKTIEDIVLICSQMSDERLGGLIVFQREVGLDDFVEDAVILDAQLNRKLLYAIFIKNSPLHDGAVLIDGNRIRAAGCVLPLSFDPDLDPNLGTRHRAALGISEVSDAAVVVISEETGAISLVRDGKLTRNLDGATLRESLHRIFSSKPEKEVPQKEAA